MAPFVALSMADSNHAAPPKRVSHQLTNEGGAVMPKGHPLSESAKERIWELRAEGLSEREIARQLKLGQNTVSHYLRALGGNPPARLAATERCLTGGFSLASLALDRRDDHAPAVDLPTGSSRASGAVPLPRRLDHPCAIMRREEAIEGGKRLARSPGPSPGSLSGSGSTSGAESRRAIRLVTVSGRR
jgi:transcriptional regulator with XRE-family HTH domain